MSIPFIRGYPSQKCRITSIERGSEIEDMSRHFHHHGGLFFCEVLANGKAHLFACIMKDEVPVEVESIECDNGPELPEAVDHLVRRAIAHLEVPRCSEA
jgi:hypothetical protein